MRSLLATTHGPVLLTSRMISVWDAQVAPRFGDHTKPCKIPFMVDHLSTTSVVATTARVSTARVQYLKMDAFRYHWPTAEIAILHAYRPVGAGLIT